MADNQNTHARTLAACLPSLGVPLPRPVANAIDALGRAAETRTTPPPRPGFWAQTATADAGIDAAYALAAGREVDFDAATAAIAGARQREQAVIDKNAVIISAREATAGQVTAAVHDHMAEIIAAVQEQYGRLARQFTERAGRLPQPMSDQRALAEGGRVRTDWLALRDLAGQLAALRETVAILHRPGAAPGGGGSLERSFSYESSGYMAEHARPGGQAPADFGDHPGSVQFYIALSKHVPDASTWWNPTTQQIAERVAQYRQRQRAQAAQRLSRLAGSDVSVMR